SGSRSAARRATAARATASPTAPTMSTSRPPARMCSPAAGRGWRPPTAGSAPRGAGNAGAKGGGGAGGGGAACPRGPGASALVGWQQGLEVTRSQGKSALQNRGVPDVAGDADPQTGYNVRVDGRDTVIGGTSAVAPLWAGLIARINSGRSRPAGFVNPQLYEN